jgi:hypothetical protein
MRKQISLAFAAAMLVAGPAHATSFLVSTTTAGNAGSNDAGRTYTATKGSEKLNVKVTGWSSINGVMDNSAVGSYGTSGLGIINRNESGAYGTHQADSSNGTDFFILQFDQAVKLTSAVFNSFAFNGYAPDNNALIGWASSTYAWNSTLPLDGYSYASLAHAFKGTATSAGTGASGSRAITLGDQAFGNVWMISATTPDGGKAYDAFKLGGFGVTTMGAVPEPATWAMMLIGFGFAGAGLRYRRRQTAVAFAAA